MAIGKESMERAAKAAGKKAETAGAVKENSGKKTAVKKTPAKKAAPVKKEAAKTVKAAETITPSKEVMEKIVYQKSAEILDRAAEPNEIFAVGDAMPIYYL